ncbi:putative minor capsid protein [Listeria booriae]|uniref:putative minor capsid protein n=1 Tax=Listeria booriae TaxID=1552123 RepID=UPI00162568F8|nr:putative minor capsid protein [Listeria booriae]MBC1982779.1 hypothetical protein [Listeria booriae]
MRLPKVPKNMLVDTFVYEEFIDEDRYGKATYKAPVLVRYVRIDRTPAFSRDVTETKIMANATIYCYADHTTPFLAFIERSKITYDEKEAILQSASSFSHPYRAEIWSYELKVI